ncbi:ribbon-helix-helix protein, CopG family [Sporolactobacillus sp. THM7-7]|nr:ribbon-helix-helix protein, CopG family [Sporolactobacillus sp. THM7-7]
MYSREEIAEMKRKQIYLSEQLDRKLARLAESKGVSQAEVIREGLEMYMQSFEDKDKVWDELVQKMKNSPFSHLTWSRDDLYKDVSRRATHEK